MKGLLKGLRYISQIFDNEKEPEMQIGYPTDVKHVAHIGWDGPSVNSPSWMNEFKSSSAPLNFKGEPQEDNALTWVSEDSSSRRNSRSSRVDGDISELPKSSRRNSISETPTKEKLEKPRRSTRSSAAKELGEGKSSRQKDKDSTQGRGESSSSSPNPASVLPKKSRRKKSKDISNSRASRSKSHAIDDSDSGSVAQSDNGSSLSANLSGLEEEEEAEYFKNKAAAAENGIS